MKNKLLLLILLIMPIKGFSFLNIESLRQSEDVGVYGSTGLKVSGARGNTDKMAVSYKVNTGYQTELNEYFLIGQYVYGTASDQKNTNRVNLHFRFTRNLSQTLSWESYVQGEFNEFKKLNLRQVYGTGLRFKLFKNETISVFNGLSAFYEKEELDLFQNQETVRASMYVSFRKLIEKKIETTIIAYYQPSLEKIKDYRLQGVISFEFFFSKNLSFSVDTKVSHDSQPPGEVDKTDVTYMTGLNFRY